MKHLSEGELRAFFDDALRSAEQAEAEQHMKTCTRCAEQAATVQRRGHQVRRLLSRLEQQPQMDAVVPGMAKRRFDILQRERKERRMVHNPFSRRYRPAWAAGALALLIILTLTIRPVRTFAGDLLQLFRVQRIEFTSVSTDTLPDEETLETLAPEIERMFEDALTITSDGERQEVSAATVHDLAPFPVRLPDSEAKSSCEWTPPVHITMEIDLPRWQALVGELGYDDLTLPKTLDGKTVRADFQGVLSAAYGSCEDSSPPQKDCITFVQMASPSATVPEGLDVDHLGRIYLELLGMPADQAERLSKQIDWTTTLVLPFPHHVNLTYETVKVDGAEGTLIHSESGYRPAREYLLTWVKGDVVYAVTGKGDHTEALALVASLR